MKTAIAVIVVALAVVVQCDPPGLSPRILNGRPVDTLRRFPHHVTISSFKGDFLNFTQRSCSGSIIHERWILTTYECVSGGDFYRLDFHRLILNKTTGSFSIVVEKDSVHPYPTLYDNIALVELPVQLVFNNELKPIQLQSEPFNGYGSFAVLPGFAHNREVLGYGMFQINYGCPSDNYDDYLQLCATGYAGNQNAPCYGNEGGGLVFGWPSKPQLVGLLSAPVTCNPGGASVYTKVSSYVDWIHQVIYGSEYVTGLPEYTPEP